MSVFLIYPVVYDIRRMLSAPPPSEQMPGLLAADTPSNRPGAAAADAMAAVTLPVELSPAERSGLDLAHIQSRSSLLLPVNARSSLRTESTPRATIDKGDRRWLSLKIGEAVARSLDILPQDHTPDELAALGEHTLLEKIASGADMDVSLLIAAAQAAGAIDEASIQGANPDELAERLNAFIQLQFANEIALCEAMDKLAELEMPTRPRLARDILAAAGVNPDLPVLTRKIRESRLTTAVWNRVLSGHPPSLTPAQRYFLRDTLTENDLEMMWTTDNVPLTPAQIEEVLARLPASLDIEFNKRFDVYARDAAEQMSILLRARLALHARANGMDLSSSTISIYRPTLQHFVDEVLPLRGGAVMYEGKAQATSQAEGYVFSVRSTDSEQRFFLSLQTGLSWELPPGIAVDAWIESNRAAVFGDAPSATARTRLRTRVAVDELATGDTSVLGDRLSGAFRKDIEQMRGKARGHTPREQMTDFLLDMIPFRSMIMAIRRNDVEGAIIAGGLDILSLMPLLYAGGRLAGVGVKVGRLGLRTAAAALASPQLAAAANAWTARLVGKASLRGLSNMVVPLREAIRKKVAQGATRAWARILSLDPDYMATVLRTSHPDMADSLRAASSRMRGANMADGWWSVRDLPANLVDDGISTMPSVVARGKLGGSLPLRRYGRSGVYTQYDAASGNRIGALLLQGQDGLLYGSLPLRTVQRYRVAAPDLLARLEGQLANANGTLTVHDRTYARVGDDYMQVEVDRATSTAERPIWRAIPPDSVAPDIIIHRIAYDAGHALWRRASIPTLDGGSGRPGRGAATPVTGDTSTAGASAADASSSSGFSSAGSSFEIVPDNLHLMLQPFQHGIRARHPNLIGYARRNYFVQGVDGQVRRFPGGYSGGTVTPELLDSEFVRSLDRIMDYSHVDALGQVLAGYRHDAARAMATYHVGDRMVPPLDPRRSIYPLRESSPAQYMIPAGDQLGEADACAQMLLAEGKTPAQVTLQLDRYRQLRLQFPRTGDLFTDTIKPLCVQLGRTVVTTYMNRSSHQETIQIIKQLLAKDAPIMLVRKGKTVILDAIETDARGNWLIIRHPGTGSQVRIRDHLEFWNGDDLSRTVTPTASDLILEDIRLITIEHDHRLRHLRTIAAT